MTIKTMSFNHFLIFSITTILIATPLSVDAKIFSLSQHKGNKWSSTDWNQQLQVIPINGGAAGPESFAFDREGGGPYTGVSDGRIIKWLANESRWIDFAMTTPDREGCEGLYDHVLTEQRCGRPLGVSFQRRTNDLYIADSYKGLLKVSPSGGIATPLVTEVQGVPLIFTNAFDIDPNTGVVYFTDSSTKYPRSNFVAVILTGDNSGRLLKLDPSTNEVTVLLDNLMFPNGVSLSKNGKFLIVAETTSSRVLKYWLEPSKAGKVEVFAQLPGHPDNVRRNHKGEFWVGINANSQSLLRTSSKIPIDNSSVWAVKLSKKGKILEVLGAKDESRLQSVSEVYERKGVLWIGSVQMPFMAKLNVSN